MLKAAGLILNEENLNAVKCAEKASVILRRHQILTFNPQTEDCMEKPDLIITFGGDGTLLIGARYAMKYLGIDARTTNGGSCRISEIIMLRKEVCFMLQTPIRGILSTH